MSRKKFEKLLKLKNYMSVMLDEKIPIDENGNYMINVGYIRVSTDRQADAGYGLDIQSEAIYKYCREHNLKNLLLFCDDGFTGTNLDRPALQGIIGIINDYNLGKSKVRIDRMIVPRIDRLSRTLYGTLQFIQDYIFAGGDENKSSVNKNSEDIEFVSIAESFCKFQKGNPHDKFMISLFASLAELDRNMIVQKLKSGRYARIKSGKWHGGGNVPFGYSYDKKSGTLNIVPEEAKKVKEVFRLYIEEKMSPQKISEKLGFKGERIVIQILKRKSLTGCVIYNGEEFQGNHKPIITLERWHEAQDEMKSRGRIRGDSVYLLSGITMCGECGAKMRYQKWNKKSGECKLVCYSQQKSKGYLVKDANCCNEKFWQSEIEDAVINELFSLSYFSNEKNIKKESEIDTIGILKEQILKENKKLSRLYALFSEDGDEILAQQIKSVKEKIKKLEKKINDENEHKFIEKKTEKAKSILRNLKDTWDYMTPIEKQSVCRELIEKVLIFKDGTVNVYLKMKNYIRKGDCSNEALFELKK